MSQWFRTVARRTIHDGHVALHVDDVETPDGQVVQREIVVTRDAVAVVALLGDDVVLVRQHRQAVDRSMLELPAGLLDVEGEDPETAAARELAEECGLAAGAWRRLTTITTSPGWSTERITILLASDVTPCPPPAGFVPEAEEAAMEVVRLPLHAALAAVRDGTITDAKTAVGLLLATSVEP